MDTLLHCLSKLCHVPEVDISDIKDLTISGGLYCRGRSLWSPVTILYMKEFVDD